MDNDLFLKSYLSPSSDALDRQFTLPLPDAEHFEKTADFIVQSHCPPTYSTNVIARFEHRVCGVRLVEVYKSSQNLASGKFVRLVGTMALVKKGLPFLFLDAAVTNIDMQTGEKIEPCTRIAVHMPQAADDARQALLRELSGQAESAGIACSLHAIAALPPFWGQLFSVHRQMIDCEAIALIRQYAWQAYAGFCSRTAPQAGFDYRPVQQQMILENSKAEQGQFQRMGLTVPVEVQAAFFSILCTGV